MGPRVRHWVRRHVLWVTLCTRCLTRSKAARDSHLACVLCCVLWVHPPAESRSLQVPLTPDPTPEPSLTVSSGPCKADYLRSAVPTAARTCASCFLIRDLPIAYSFSKNGTTGPPMPMRQKPSSLAPHTRTFRGCDFPGP